MPAAIPTWSRSAAIGLSAPAASATAKPPKEPRDAPPPAAVRRRLSFKDKHALERLPARIADLREQLAGLASLLADPSLHGRDPKAFERASRDYGVRQVDLERAEEEWLTLEMLREEIEG